MKLVKVALLYNPAKSTSAEQESAFAGLQRFRQFGVVCDSIDVSKKGAVKEVKRGYNLADLINSPDGFVHPYDIQFASMREAFESIFTSKSTLGVGLTSTPLRYVYAEGEGEFKEERATGLSFIGSGAIVTSSSLRKMDALGPDSDNVYRNLAMSLAPKAIKQAVIHELGHVFGKKNHCTDGECVMQENRDFRDFLENHVTRGLDFCRQCLVTISNYIEQLGYDLSENS